MSGFGMTGGLASELAELLEVIHRQLVAQKVEQNVLQSATVGPSQTKARIRKHIDLTHDYTNSLSKRRSCDTTVKITHPLDKMKRSLLNHLECLGLALKTLIEIPDSL